MRLLIFILCTLLLTACSDADSLLVVGIDNHLQEDESLSFSPLSLPFPAGTTFETKGSTVHFDLPEPFVLMGFTASGTFTKATGRKGSITCTCKSEYCGCNPTKVLGELGCALSSCSLCEKTVDIAKVEEKLEYMIIVDPDGTAFLTSLEEVEGQMVMPSQFMQAPIMQEIYQYIDQQSLQYSSSETKDILMKAYGYLVTVNVPVDADLSSPTFLSPKVITANGESERKYAVVNGRALLK